MATTTAAPTLGETQTHFRTKSNTISSIKGIIQ